MTLAADEDYLHVEITLNANELVFFAEWDADGDGRLSTAELAAHEDVAAQSVYGAIELQSAGRCLAPEVVGLVPGGDSHHLTFRAHYAASVCETALTVQSRLGGLTRGAHSTQAVFQTPQGRETAVLDARTPRVTFNRAFVPSEVVIASSSQAAVVTTPSASWQRIGVTCTAVLLSGLLFFSVRHRSRVAP
ncbi:MAG: hypothetical protein KDA44_12925 [Planctomycetales bacterium]|nr:hypothetical protein [Planctomycetales bacterium]